MAKLIRNISLYSLGGVLSKSIQFLLLPLYAHYLSPSDYGKLELTYLFGAVLVIFYGFIIENGYSRFFFDKNEENYRNTLFGTAFFFKMITGAFFLGFSLLSADLISSVLFNFDEGKTYIKLISISVFIKSISEIPLKTLIVEKRAGRYVINNVLYLIASLISTVYFVVVLDLNIVGVLYGQILGASVQLATLLYTEWKWSFIRFSFSNLKGMLYFSLFLIPTQLASFVTYWSNRLFLQKFSSLHDVGTFSFGYKIASIIPILLTMPIKKALGPEIYELIDRPNECRKRIRQFSLLVLIFLSLFALGLSLFAKELILLMASKAYTSSHEVVFVLSMGYVLIGMAGIVVLPIQITKKTWLITITWVLSSVFNIALNIVLVPLYGKSVAMYASFLTFLFILIMYFIFGEKTYTVNFEYKKYIFVLIIVSFSYILGAKVNTEIMVINILLKGVLWLLVCSLMCRIFLSKEHRLKIRYYFRYHVDIRNNRNG